jgi:hypothetical protein
VTRWRAQGIAVVAWVAGAAGLACVVRAPGGQWIDIPGPSIYFVFVFGPIAAAASVATTIVVAVWRGISLRVLVGLHVAIALACLIALAAAR